MATKVIAFLISISAQGWAIVDFKYEPRYFDGQPAMEEYACFEDYTCRAGDYSFRLTR